MSEQPLAILGVTNTQLSIARHYGGIRYNGTEYVYISELDALLRCDKVKGAKRWVENGGTVDGFLKALNARNPNPTNEKPAEKENGELF